MYRYYKLNDYMVMEYDFSSISEFIDYLDTAPINKNVWSNHKLDSESIDYEWYQTNSFKEAKELCQYGYHKDFNKLVELKINLEKYIKFTNNKMAQYNFYVGYAPDVKAYLEGSPLSMLNRQNPKRKQINIYFCATMACVISANQAFNRGAITLCLVEMLENMGFSVNLNIFTMSELNRKIHYAKFDLKHFGERLNIQKLYFPICHPSFLRRLVFRLEEQTPDIPSGWPLSYGYVCDDYTIRQILDLKDNDIVINMPDEMGIIGNDIIEDANNMFEYINNFNSETVKLEHIKRTRRL